MNFSIHSHKNHCAGLNVSPKHPGQPTLRTSRNTGGPQLLPWMGMVWPDAATPMVQEKKEWKNLTNLTWTFALSMVHGPFNSSPALAPIHPPSLILSFSPLSLSLVSLLLFLSLPHPTFLCFPFLWGSSPHCWLPFLS